MTGHKWWPTLFFFFFWDGLRDTISCSFWGGGIPSQNSGYKITRIYPSTSISLSIHLYPSLPLSLICVILAPLPSPAPSPTSSLSTHPPSPSLSLSPSLICHFRCCLRRCLRRRHVSSAASATYVCRSILPPIRCNPKRTTLIFFKSKLLKQHEER